MHYNATTKVDLRLVATSRCNFLLFGLAAAAPDSIASVNPNSTPLTIAV